MLEIGKTTTVENVDHDELQRAMFEADQSVGVNALEALGRLRKIAAKARSAGFVDLHAGALLLCARASDYLGRHRQMDRYAAAAEELIENDIEPGVTQARLQSWLGTYHGVRGSAEKAMRLLQAARAVLEPDHTHIPEYFQLLQALGVLYHRLGAIDMALEIYLRHYDGAIAVGATGPAIDSLATIAALYDTLGEHENALQYYRKASELERKKPNTLRAATIAHGIGRTNVGLGRCDEAMKWLRGSLAMWREIGSVKMEYWLMKEIGGLHREMGDYRDALSLLKSALQMAEEADDRVEIAGILRQLGKTYMAIEDLESARTMLLRALSIVEAHHITGNLSDLHRDLGGIYEKQGAFADALHHHQRCTELREEIVGTKRQRAIAHVELAQMKQQARKKETILLRRLSNVQKEAEDSRKERDTLALNASRQQRALSRLNDLVRSADDRGDVEELTRAIQEIVRSTAVQGPRGMLDEHLSGTHRGLITAMRRIDSSITPTELTVAVLIRNGMGTKEIASTLFCAESTVASHRKSIRRKLGVPQQANLTGHLLALDGARSGQARMNGDGRKSTTGLR